MSLLNEVLQDLDRRSAPPTQRPLKLAKQPPVPPAAEAADRESGADLMRWLVWSVVALAVCAAVWVFVQTPDQGQNVRQQPLIPVGQSTAISTGGAESEEDALASNRAVPSSVSKSQAAPAVEALGDAKTPVIATHRQVPSSANDLATEAAQAVRRLPGTQAGNETANLTSYAGDPDQETAAANASPSAVNEALILASEPVETFVRTWAADWSRQDVAAYLDRYAEDFRPAGGISRDAWAQQRRLRLTKPSFITVDLTALETKFVDDRHASVSFDQAYRANDYRDRVRKALLLRRQGTRWEILSERSWSESRVGKNEVSLVSEAGVLETRLDDFSNRTVTQSSAKSSAGTGSDTEQRTNYLPLNNVDSALASRALEGDLSAPVKTRASDRRSAAERARRQIDVGDLAAAEQTVTDRLIDQPADREARELLIGLMLRGGRYAAAGRVIDEGLVLHPGHRKMLLIKARLLAQAGETAAAVSMLESLQAEGGGSAGVLQMLGALYQRQQRFDEAVTVYRRLAALRPTMGAAWAGLAISLDGLGDASALDAYRRALSSGDLPAAVARYARQRQASLEAGNG